MSIYNTVFNFEKILLKFAKFIKDYQRYYKRYQRMLWLTIVSAMPFLQQQNLTIFKHPF